MAFVTPRLFPKELFADYIPAQVRGMKEGGPFYIPNCQPLDQVVEINRLAEFILHEGRTQCLTPEEIVAKKSFQHYSPEKTVLKLDSGGRISVESLKTLHVFRKEDYTQWSQKGLSTCPVCSKEVTVLVDVSFVGSTGFNREVKVFFRAKLLSNLKK